MKLLVAGEPGHHMGKMVGTLDQLWSIVDATGSTPAKLAKKYQVWHKQMAENNPRSSRPVSLLTKGRARIYLTQMRKSLRKSLKVEKAKGVGQQEDPRQ
jgi:hypothetical protein